MIFDEEESYFFFFAGFFLAAFLAMLWVSFFWLVPDRSNQVSVTRVRCSVKFACTAQRRNTNERGINRAL
ncbi:MAG: hypothetical protein JWM32_2517 [Verrucomicrobia bacterium]|nr:hypothetical protein [Verrucomicrobiota bacterium]